MESRIKTLKEEADKRFQERLPLMSLLQEIAENFYAERADFTNHRVMGVDFSANMMTGIPAMARRDLGNTFSSMLRPTNKEWFHTHTTHEDREDNDAKQWLQWAEKIQRNAMYDPITSFHRATKEADHDFAAFGQCVLSCEFNADANALLYRCWHLRDVAWCEGYDGKISDVYRKWKPYVCDLNRLFKGNISAEAKRKMEKDPYTEIDVIHAVKLTENYDYPGKRWVIDKKGNGGWNTKYVSIFMEADGGHILEEIGIHNSFYLIPRWQTVSGSQYAFSPATMIALSDARMIQSMMLVLLEAGEKAVDPPMIMRDGILRDDVNLFRGGMTYVDIDSDARIQDAIQVLTNDKSGLQFGMEMLTNTKEAISEAFFLNKLNMPPAGGPDMTAYEVGQRVQEYIRNALPLFEPMEMEYNAGLCNITFDILHRNGAFGAPQDMPPSLSDQEIQFRFESPLHDALEAQKAQVFQQAQGILAAAAALDPNIVKLMDVRTAVRDTMDGVRVPAAWLRNEKYMQALDEQAAQAQQAQQTLALMQQGGDAAKALGVGGQALNGVMQGAVQ